MKILIDADLILELLVNRSEKVKDAEEIWKLAESQHIEGFVTNVGLEKIYFICRELTDENRADEIVWSLEKVVSSCNLDKNIIKKASSSRLQDFESAIELTCAKYMGFDGVVTHCLQNFSGYDSNVWSVHELLAALKNSQENQKFQTTKKLLNLYTLDISSDENALEKNLHSSRFIETNSLGDDELSKINNTEEDLYHSIGRSAIELPQIAATKKYRLEDRTEQANIFEAKEKRNYAFEKIMLQKAINLSVLRFRLSIFAVLSTIVVLLGCTLLFTGKMTEGTITSTSGALLALAFTSSALIANNSEKKIKISISQHNKLLAQPFSLSDSQFSQTSQRRLLLNPRQRRIRN